MLTDEKREQLQLIQRCDPSFLLLSVKEHTNFDSALLEKVFELAKEQTRSLLAASAAPAKVDNWQQYAKEGETAQRCIERHRAEQDALLKLYGRAAPADEGRETADEKFNPYVEPEATTNQTLTEAIEWCIAHGNCGPRTRATLIAARSALATAPTMPHEGRETSAPTCNIAVDLTRELVRSAWVKRFNYVYDRMAEDAELMGFARAIQLECFKTIATGPTKPADEGRTGRTACCPYCTDPHCGGCLATAPTMSEAARLRLRANRVFVKAVEAALKAWITEHYACSRERMMSVLDAWYAREDALRHSVPARIDRAAAKGESK